MLLDPSKPEVTPIPSEPYRFQVASSKKGESYLVDLEARWPMGRCTCINYECKRWPKFKETLYPVRCKHLDAALEFYALLCIKATSRNLKNNDGE